VLVTRLPYRPKEDRAKTDPLVRIARILQGLTHGQAAVILGPADLLVDAIPPHLPSARDRGQLLESGRVEAVVRLPGGLMPFRPGYQTALWVLRRDEPDHAKGRVLLADVSDRPLTCTVVDELIADIVTWRRPGYRPDAHARAFAAQVAIADLTGPNIPLTTRRPISIRALAARADQTVARVADIETELDQITADNTSLRSSIGSGLAVRTNPTPYPDAPVATLLKGGRLKLVQGSRIADIDIVTIEMPDQWGTTIGLTGRHVVVGPAEVLGDSHVGTRTIDRAVLADRYPRAGLTQPNDVIVTLTPRFGLYLDHTGFNTVEFPARALRVDPNEQQLTPRLLAAMLSPGTGGIRAPGAVRAPTRLEQLRVPLLPPVEVERLDALLTAMDRRRQTVCRELDLLDELRRTAVSSLADGTLTITAPKAST